MRKFLLPAYKTPISVLKNVFCTQLEAVCTLVIKNFEFIILLLKRTRI